MHVNVNLMVKKVTQMKSGITINANVNVKIWENIMCAGKDYIWNDSTCTWEELWVIQ